MSTPPAARTTARLLHDLIAVAQATGTPYDERTLVRVLGRFECGFTEKSVQIRTTDKPLAARDLSFRYLDLDLGDGHGDSPLDVALRSGELRDDGHPLCGWLQAVEHRFPSLGYGADFEACRGLQKIWSFFTHAHEPRALLGLAQLPAGFRNSLPLLRDLHLDAITIIGVDYMHRTMNLYFRPSHPSHGGPELVTRACERLGFAAPSEAAQRHAGRAGCIAFTYHWERPAIERICFYVAGHGREVVSQHYPQLATFAAQAPALVSTPHFIIGCSHGHDGVYQKIEDDYTGDVTQVFGRAMGVPAATDFAPGGAAPTKTTHRASTSNGGR